MVVVDPGGVLQKPRPSANPGVGESLTAARRSATHHLLREDDDGRFYLEYISWNAYFGLHGDVDGYDDYLASISRMVKAQLKSKGACVREKGLWLHRLYIDALDAMLAQPEDSQFYGENEAACLAAHELPRFKKSANAVRKELRRKRRKLKRLDTK